MKQLRTRLLGIVMACAMLISLFPATALAAGSNVAEVNGISYTTLEDAIANVQNNGTVKLLTDFTLSNTITVTGKTFTYEQLYRHTWRDQQRRRDNYFFYRLKCNHHRKW